MSVCKRTNIRCCSSTTLENSSKYKIIAAMNITFICRHEHVRPFLEYIVKSEMTNHLNFDKIITDAKHGFRKKRFCETQLILTIDDLAREIDKGGQTHMILLDLCKAFNRVPYQRLLLKLKSYGITGNTNKFIQNLFYS